MKEKSIVMVYSAYSFLRNPFNAWPTVISAWLASLMLGPCNAATRGMAAVLPSNAARMLRLSIGVSMGGWYIKVASGGNPDIMLLEVRCFSAELIELSFAGLPNLPNLSLESVNFFFRKSMLLEVLNRLHRIEGHVMLRVQHEYHLVTGFRNIVRECGEQLGGPNELV